LDVIFEIFQRSLPKHLQPHAFKIVFGAFVLTILLFMGYAYGWTELLAFVIFGVLLYVALALWIFVKWLFTGRS